MSSIYSHTASLVTCFPMDNGCSSQEDQFFLRDVHHVHPPAIYAKKKYQSIHVLWGAKLIAILKYEASIEALAATSAATERHSPMHHQLADTGCYTTQQKHPVNAVIHIAGTCKHCPRLRSARVGQRICLIHCMISRSKSTRTLKQPTGYPGRQDHDTCSGWTTALEVGLWLHITIH